MSDTSKRLSSLLSKRQALAELLLQEQGVDVSRASPRRRKESDVTALSFAQGRLWFMDQLEPDSPFYNIAASYAISAPLDIDLLTRALNEIVRRHESLRTTFSLLDGQPAQIIAASLKLEIP